MTVSTRILLCAATPTPAALLWRSLPVRQWQSLPCYGAGGAGRVAGEGPLLAKRLDAGTSDIWFHGAALGPRPLLVLPGFLPRAPADHPPSATLNGFHALLQAMQHRHGALAITFDQDSAADAAAKVGMAASSLVDRVAASTARGQWIADNEMEAAAASADGMLSAYCHKVAAMCETFALRYCDVIATSIGAIVAVKMALLFPERIGSLCIIDTPLVTRRQLEYHKLRREIGVAARCDASNVPVEMLAAYAAQLEGRASPGASSSEGETADASWIYPPKLTVHSGGSTDDRMILDALESGIHASCIKKGYDAFAAVDASSKIATRMSLGLNQLFSDDILRSVRHPVLTITTGPSASASGSAKPSAAAAATSDDGDDDATKETLNVRRSVTLKAADANWKTIGSPAAAEAASTVSNFFLRYDADAVLAKRWASAAQDMTRLLPTSQAASADASSSSATPSTEDKPSKKGKKGGQRPDKGSKGPGGDGAAKKAAASSASPAPATAGPTP